MRFLLSVKALETFQSAVKAGAEFEAKSAKKQKPERMLHYLTEVDFKESAAGKANMIRFLEAQKVDQTKLYGPPVKEDGRLYLRVPGAPAGSEKVPVVWKELVARLPAYFVQKYKTLKNSLPASDKANRAGPSLQNISKNFKMIGPCLNLNEFDFIFLC